MIVASSCWKDSLAVISSSPASKKNKASTLKGDVSTWPMCHTLRRRRISLKVRGSVHLRARPMNYKQVVSPNKSTNLTASTAHQSRFKLVEDGHCKDRRTTVFAKRRPQPKAPKVLQPAPASGSGPKPSVSCFNHIRAIFPPFSSWAAKHEVNGPAKVLYMCCNLFTSVTWRRRAAGTSHPKVCRDRLISESE